MEVYFSTIKSLYLFHFKFGSVSSSLLIDKQYYLSPCSEAQRAFSVGSAPPLHENTDTWFLCYGLRIVPPDLGTENCVVTAGVLIDCFFNVWLAFQKRITVIML